MKYLVDKAFVDASGGTWFHEFSKGRPDFANDEDCFWRPDSVYMEDEVLSEIELDRLFAGAIDNYDYFGNTFVNPEQWERVCALAAERGGEWSEAVHELAPWVEATLAECGAFTIIGM